MKPRQAKVYCDRAVVYAALGSRDKALADLNKAVSINPEDARALSLRAQLGGASGDFEQSTIDNYQAVKAAATIDDKGHYSNKTGGVSRNLVSDSDLRLQKESIHILAAPGQISLLAGLFANICLRQLQDEPGALKQLSQINEKNRQGSFSKNMVSFAANKVEQSTLLKSAANM